MKKHTLKLSALIAACLLSVTSLNAQTGTWTKVATNAPHSNMGVMILLTDGTVMVHNTQGGTYGTGWDKLTPNSSGSYVNGTWTSLASMGNDRLFFPTQVLQDGRVFVAGGEYGAGATKGEVYNPATNTWTATGTVVSNQNIYDGNSEILPNGTVLVGVQNGLHPSFDNLIWTPSTNAWTTAAINVSPYNHDEAHWLKLPDNSILFVGISSTSSCRYIPATGTWVNDGTVPVQLYDTYGSEAGAAFMLPNGKAVFFGATGHNAIYTPTGTTSPGTWTTAADFPKIQGLQMGTTDAPSAMMVNGKILCAVSPIGTSANKEFNNPVYFVEYDYTTNTFAQVKSVIPGQGGDSVAGVSCYQTNMLDLPDGTVLFSVDQASISNQYFVYTPNGAALAAGKPTIDGILPSSCPTYKIVGKLFNGISEGAAYGDDWQMETNYPIVRLTNGTNVYYAKTTNWNRIGAVQTGSLEDTALFTLPVIPTGTYSLVVVANGIPSSPVLFTTLGITIASQTNISCNGGKGSITANAATGGISPYTYTWTPSGGTSVTASNLSAGTYTITAKDANNCTATASATITQPAAALTVTIASHTDAGCSGLGTATANAATGGTSPYTYNWTPSGGTSVTASNLSAGTYTITATDNHACTASASVTISQTSSLRDSVASGTNPLCNGGTGSATVGVKGGATPYTYTWSPNVSTSASATGLSAGTYTVTIKDKNNCTSSLNVSITQPSALAVNPSSVSNVNCNGGSNGSGSAAPTGGTSPYAYAWSGGGTNSSKTGLSAGTYTITVTDNHSCTGTATVTITQPAVLTVSIASQINISCFGGTGSATANGAGGGTSPYTYTWTPSGGTNLTALNLSAGTYTITASDAHLCTATASVTLTQPVAALSETIASHTNINCFGGTGSATANAASGGTSPYTYNWTPNGGSSLTASSLSAGTYTITATDAHSCTSTASVTITQPGSALAISIASHVDAGCNGSNGSATANAATGGTSPYTYNWTPNGGTNLTTSNITAGTYTITATDAHGCTATASVTISQPASTIVMSISSQTNINCFGGTGSATANAATGGTSPYSYNWTPSGGTGLTASNLNAGTYTITATDSHSCTGTASVTITQPASALSVSMASHTNINCFGGTGSATSNAAAGGTSPYAYSWTPNGGSGLTASNLSAGSYTVTATDAHNCSSTASVTITQPASSLTITIVSQTNINCYGGSGNATANAATGGTSPYTYTWLPSGGTGLSATNLSTGTYTITATDAHSCTATASVTITQPALLTVSITSFTGVSCYGAADGSATAGANGGTSPYSYLWSHGGTGATVSNVNGGSDTCTVTDNHGCTATVSIYIPYPGPLSSGISGIVNIGCRGVNNGSATVTASGGTTPYTYLWSPGGGTNATGSNLSAGTYTTTVTDAHHCTTTATVTLTQPATALTASISTHADVLCNGSSTGSASVTATGGTPAYTYAWSNAATSSAISNLTAGSYTVTVTDKNGCQSTASYTVTQPAAVLSVTITLNNNVICHGQGNGNATAVAAGGTSAFTYLWSNAVTKANVTNLASGTWKCTVTDAHGCTATANVTITAPAVLSATFTTTSTSCYGGNDGSSTASPTGGTPPYTAYSWTPSGRTSANVSGLSAGTYTVTITDNNSCTGTASVKISQPALLYDSIVSQACGTATAGTRGGTSPYTYSWSPSGGTGAKATGLSIGTYTVNVTDHKGCTAFTVVSIGCGAGPMRNDNNNSSSMVCCDPDLSGFNLYPNPNNGQFTIESIGFIGQWSVEIYDVMGQKVYALPFLIHTSSLMINLDSQPSGIYLVRIISKDGTFVLQKKVVLNK